MKTVFKFLFILALNLAIIYFSNIYFAFMNQKGDKFTNYIILLIPTISLLYLFYAQSKYNIFYLFINKTNLVFYCWLNQKEKKDYKKYYKNYQEILKHIDELHLYAASNNLVKNSIKTYSSFTKLGKKINEALQELELKKHCGIKQKYIKLYKLPSLRRVKNN